LIFVISESVKATREWAMVMYLLLAALTRQAVCLMSVLKLGSLFACVTCKSRRNSVVRAGTMLSAVIFMVGLS
jgi:hypothetical protein